MKKLILALLIFACSCSYFESKQQRVHALITHYVKANLNDPDSYVSVSFSDMYKLRDTVVMINGNPETINQNGAFEILHTYRCKNAFGGVITHKDWYQVDSSFTKVACCFVGQHNKEAGNN